MPSSRTRIADNKCAYMLASFWKFKKFHYDEREINSRNLNGSANANEQSISGKIWNGGRRQLRNYVQMLEEHHRCDIHFISSHSIRVSVPQTEREFRISSLRSVVYHLWVGEERRARNMSLRKVVFGATKSGRQNAAIERKTISSWSTWRFSDIRNPPKRV